MTWICFSVLKDFLFMHSSYMPTCKTLISVKLYFLCLLFTQRVTKHSWDLIKKRKKKRKPDTIFWKCVLLILNRKLPLTAMRWCWINPLRKSARSRVERSLLCRHTTESAAHSSQGGHSTAHGHVLARVQGWHGVTALLGDFAWPCLVCVSAFADFVAQKGKWSPWVKVDMKRRSRPLTDRSNRTPLVKQKLDQSQGNSKDVHRSEKWN